MSKVFTLAILLSTGMLPAEEVHSVTADTSQVQIQQHVRKVFRPMKALHHVHESFVNVAIHLSSMGIDQPADHIDEADLTPVTAPLFSEAQRPACPNQQLTAMVTFPR